MDIGKYLLEQIRMCRRKLNMAKLLDLGILYAAAGGIAGILCEFFSLIHSFYYADLAAAFCFAAGLLAGVCRAFAKRADMKQAAGKLDSFGLQERMLTAYENMDKKDEISQLQRQDTFDCYERLREQIKIPVWPDKRHVLALFLSVAAVVLMSFLPSAARDQAFLRHQVKEQAKEERKELEEFLETLDDVDMESLTEEQRTKLQELLDTMELSREELSKADSWESLSGATQRLDYKYGQAAQSLERLAGQIAHPEAAGVASAEAFAKAAANQSGQQTASSGTGSGSSGRDDGHNGDGTSSGEADGEDGKNGSGEGDGSDNGNGSGGGDGQGSGNGSGGGDGKDGGNGSGGGNGQDSGNSSGGGNGQGSGSGSGEGSGQGNGNGSGSGRGEGHSDAAHDYVSVPGEMGDDASLTGNKNGDRNSDYYREQNGLAWEGDHVEYSAVIGEYTDSAYEGIANGKYPEGMESVIRDYFEQLNQ